MATARTAHSLLTRRIHPLFMISPPGRVPDIPDGWEIGPPDFVGVGAAKAGTTWWWSVILAHPDISGGRTPDGGFASGADIRPMMEEIYRKKEFHFFDHYGHVASVEPALYHRYFPRRPGTLTGEWTPRYMYDFWTPPMLSKMAPHAKILVMLRDPLERLTSAIAHAMNVIHKPVLEYCEAARDENMISFLEQQVGRGLYWHQMQALLSYFDRKEILVLQYEQCKLDFAAQARRSFAFLGLDPDKWMLPANGSQPVGLVSGAKPVLGELTSDAIRQSYKPDLHRLLTEFPEIDGSLWPTAEVS
jgi:hypothetical protein